MSNHWRVDTKILGKILYIGVPNGLENSIFQIGKLLTTSLIAGFGMAATTANAVTGSIASFQQIPANAIGVAMITVIGQCIGAGETEQALYYLKNDEGGVCLHGPVGNSHDYFCKADLRNLSSESGDNENNCFSVMLQLCMLYAGASVVLCTVQCTSRCGRCEIYHDRGDRFHVALPCGHGIYPGTGSGTWRHRRLDRYDHGLGRTGILFTNRVRTGKWLKYKDRLVK